MDYPDEMSAIDDSYYPIPLPQTGTAGPELGDPPLIHELYNAPRSGHWTVASTTNGSGIDDRVPTIYGTPAGLCEGGAVPVKRIGGSLLKRLALATEKQKNVGEERKPAASVANESVRPDQVQPEKKEGFHVPKVEDTRGIRIKSRTGRNEIVKEPVIPSPTPLPAIPEKAAVEKSTTVTARVSSVPQSVRSDGAASRPSLRTTKTVRVVAKNGEEGFVELPVLPRSSASISSPKSEVKEPQHPPASDDKAEKARRDAAAAKAAMKMKEEREAEDARAAATAMMSGALPDSSGSSVKSSVRKSSSKGSGESFEAVFDKPSKARSVASSMTTVTKPPRKQMTPPQQESKSDSRRSSKPRSKQKIPAQQESKSGSGESLKPPSKQKTPAQQESKSNSRESSKPWPNHGMQEVGWGEYEPAVHKMALRLGSTQSNPSSGASGSKPATPQHSTHGVPGFQENPPTGRRPPSVQIVSGGRSVSQSNTYEHSFRGGPGFEEVLLNNYHSPSVHTMNSKRSVSQHTMSEHSYQSGYAFEEVSPNSNWPRSVHTVASGRSASQQNLPQHSMRSAPEFIEVYPNESVSGSVHTVNNHRSGSRIGSEQYPIHGVWGFEALNQGGSNRGSVHTISSHGSAIPRDLSPRQPTVFAGRGWISPHPLSEPPSEYRRAPETEIVLPAVQERGPTTLTYDEWKSMQQGGSPVEEVEERHRNWWRTSSQVRSYDGGSWGRRQSGGFGSYRAPTVEGVESDGQRSVTGRRQMDVVEEVGDGQVQLRMPWDDQEGWW